MILGVRSRRPRRGWSHGVPVQARGPGESYRPDDAPPSIIGRHQPGIATPVLDHLAFAALHVTADTRAMLRDLIGELGDRAERLMRAEHRLQGARPAGALTVTLGLGPGIFDDRFGLAPRRPVALAALPSFPGDDLDPQASGGDLSVHVCADTLPKAEHALARLVDIDRAVARARWTQRASMLRRAGERPDGRPRNLLGFKDATAIPRRGKDLDRHVWIAGGERSWMAGGTFLVVRRIRVLLDAWNALTLAEQERVIGRHRDSGAPLGRSHEFEAMPLDSDLIPPDAHARVAAPETNGGARLLRRGYSYDNGRDERGQRDAGLLLLLFCRDPRRQFIPLQRRLAEHDALARFSRPTGSAIFAIPPGTTAGHGLAHELLAG
jgi:deferrochelatase/peroxidase EfeB